MIEQNVQVARLQDERIWVQMGTQSGCSNCENGRGCGAGVFSRLLRRKAVLLELPRNNLDVQPGQMITLAIPEKTYISLVFGSYGWPLLAALAGGIAGYNAISRLQPGPALVDLGTLGLGLFCGYLTLRFYAGRFRGRGLESKLQSVVYYSAVNPNMCKQSGPAATGRNGL